MSDEPRDWHPVKCNCGSPHCERYGLNTGMFYEGCGFDGLEDARLAAAAPEMHKALSAFVNAAKSWHDFHHGTNIPCDLLCDCIPAGEAAIAKASGKT